MTIDKVLLFGNPNVGKSAVFSRLSGANVLISNYPGSTVEFSEGKLKYENRIIPIIDVPGTYSLEATSKAEETAVNMLGDESVIINVIDATNLERNLYLTMELLEKNIPMIIALNMWDETKHKGISIDIEKLEQMLGVPVVHTCALSGEGIKTLIDRLKDARSPHFKARADKERWEDIGRIILSAQKLTHKHHTIWEELEDISMNPALGLVFAAGVIFMSFLIVRFISEGLITRVMEPAFELFWKPPMTALSRLLGEGTVLHNILIGKLIDGQIDFQLSFGVLTTGIFIQLAAIMPYILGFYLVLGLLEDSGYLPRLAVLVDNIMHKIGLHGYAIIPMILSMGCKVPGILATRILEERREKFIAATLFATAVPCMSQTAMIIGLVGARGGQYLLIVFGTLFSIIIIKGMLLNKLMKGASPEILVEIPPYRMPHFLSVIKKLWMRLTGYLADAFPYVLLGILIVNILYITNVVKILGDIFAPVIAFLWGLPKEAVSSLIVGLLRKDVAVALLAPLNMTTKQLVISSTLLAVYFPCIATFVVLFKELGVKDMLKSTALMLTTSLIVGVILNLAIH